MKQSLRMQHLLALGLGLAACRNTDAPRHTSSADQAPEGVEPAAAADPAPLPPPDEPPSPQAGDPTLIDGMSASDNALDGPGLKGYWYTYSDGTGRLDPRPGSSMFPPVMAQDHPARECSGGGQTHWGAGFGFDFRDVGPAGSVFAGPTPVDLSRHSGIRFDALSKGAPVDLLVTMSDADTNPRAGICDPSGADASRPCNGDYQFTVHFPPDHWATRTVAFNDLHLPSWSHYSAARVHGFQRDRVYSMHFQTLAPDAGKPARDFDVLVSNVRFVDDAVASSR